MKKFAASFLAILLAVCLLPTTAFAATWYIEDGDILVSASSSGQTVSQGSNSQQDSAPVITNRDSTTAYGNNVTVSSAAGSSAELTLKDTNIQTDGRSAVEVGSATAGLVVEGENKLVSGDAPAVHVTDGDLTISGNGKLEAETYDSGTYAAGIGSTDGEDMSGSITIGGNATVVAYANDDGAGIGSGYGGDMTGSITVKDSAKVDAESNWDGAGIGSGEGGDMTGTIHITGNADVDAYSDFDGVGIGAGESAELSGTVLIDGNARVRARSANDGAGIGAGENGYIGKRGSVIIGGNANVTAIGEDEAAGIGSGEDEVMAGAIIIRDKATVYAYAGERAAAIGSDDPSYMTGTIMIIDSARVFTGVADEYGKKIDGRTGYIGDSYESSHDSENGAFVIAKGATINGVKGSDIEGLKAFINMHLDKDGKPTNLTLVETVVENGEVKYLPLYRVTDEKGNDLPYSASISDGKLTIKAAYDTAVLTGSLNDLKLLSNMGIEEIVFVTNGGQSEFETEELLGAGAGAEDYKLSHEGEKAVLTADGKELKDILD